MNLIIPTENILVAYLLPAFNVSIISTVIAVA